MLWIAMSVDVLSLLRKPQKGVNGDWRMEKKGNEELVPESHELSTVNHYATDLVNISLSHV